MINGGVGKMIYARTEYDGFEEYDQRESDIEFKRRYVRPAPPRLCPALPYFAGQPEIEPAELRRADGGQERARQDHGEPLGIGPHPAPEQVFAEVHGNTKPVRQQALPNLRESVQY